MKLKTAFKTKRAVLSLEKQADMMAENYLNAVEASKAASNTVNTLKEDIKSFAASQGDAKGKCTLVEGEVFEVGFATTDPAPVFDASKAKTILPPSLYKQCLTPMLDEAKVEKLVLAKKIKRSQFMAMCNVPAPQKRIVVRKKGSNDEGL
jgi:hypothetical protein